MGCTVAELSRRLTVAEFHEWAEYYAIEPWGEGAGNWQTAIIGAFVMKALGGKGVKISAENLMPGRREKVRQTAEDMHAAFLAATRGMHADER